MTSTHRKRLGLEIVLLAAVVALVCAVPSLSRPQAAQAQSICGPTYGSILFSGLQQGCSNVGGACSSFIFSSCGLNGCSGTGTVVVTGCGYGYGSGCGYGYGSCSGCGYGVYGACGGGCGYGSYGAGYSSGCSSGSCYGGYSIGCAGSTCGYGAVYGCSTIGGCGSLVQACVSGGSCPIVLGAGQTCSNGVVGCTGGGYLYSGSQGCNGAYPATNSITCPSGTYATSSGCASPTSSVVCGGSGVTASSQSQCPTVCPDQTFVAAGQQCPASASVYNPNNPSASAAGPGAASPNAILVSAVHSGWNLVGGPNGATITGAVGPTYTYQANDTAYETGSTSSPLKGGVGYWVDFGSGTTVSLPVVGPGQLSIPLPPGQFIMIGDPGTAPATVTGADTVFVFDPSSGYINTSTLAPGQGAWAESDKGGQASISWGAPAPPPSGPQQSSPSGPQQPSPSS